jgi:predicted amidohydrolase
MPENNEWQSAGEGTATGHSIAAAALQFAVGMDVGRNVSILERLMEEVPRGGFAVAPEGALSGYLPKSGFVAEIDNATTNAAIGKVRSLVKRMGKHLVVGACLCDGGIWRNSALYLGPGGELHRYDKINLARSERGTFTPGDTLPVFDIVIEGKPVRLGIQMCREIRYPEQWRMLASQGAHLIAFVNNAVGSARRDDVWRAHMISRAAELQRFVVGANNAAVDQTCPSMIVSPSGEILGEVKIGAENLVVATLRLEEISNWNLSQSRDDVVQVELRRSPSSGA